MNGATLDQCLAAKTKATDFNGVAEIARGDEISFAVRGLSAGPGSAALTRDFRFNLASAGKMFTAVAVGQLLDAGKVKLDDPIGRYVDGLTSEASVATVRQLLTHSSGLGDYISPENFPIILKARSLSALKPLIVTDKPSFKPGARFGYSNTGFLLLGLMIETISGEGYGNYLDKHIFKPAGMAATSLDPQMAGTSTAMEMSAMAPGGPLQPGPKFRGSCAGGAYSTADDMRRFFAALTSGKLVRTETYIGMVSPQILAYPGKDGRPDVYYGLGFGVGKFDGHRWFGHNGGAPGVNSEVNFFVDDQTALVVLSNRDPPGGSALYKDLRGIALGKAVCETKALTSG